LTRKLLVPLTFALTLVVVATAWAGSFSHADYQGRIESDHGTFFGFDLTKAHGITKVSHIETFVKLQCGNGEAGQVALKLNGSLRVKSNDGFKGTLRANPAPSRGTGNPPSVRATVAGKLQKHGKAKGKLDVSFDFIGDAPRGGTRVHCYSGAVDWKVKRGAVVNPDFLMQNRLR
jgi:hypothetical protein